MERPVILLGLMIAILPGAAPAQDWRDRPARPSPGEARMMPPPSEQRRPTRCRESGGGSLIGAIAGGLLGRAGPRRDDRAANGYGAGRDRDRDC